MVKKLITIRSFFKSNVTKHKRNRNLRYEVLSTGSRKNHVMSNFCDTSSNIKSNEILACTQLEFIEMCVQNYFEIFRLVDEYGPYILTRCAILTPYKS